MKGIPGQPLFVADGAAAAVGWRQGLAVTAAAFLDAVRRTADGFAPGLHVLNLCRDRLNFAITFCATVLAGRISLQPPNYAPATIDHLRQAYPDLQIADDATTAPIDGAGAAVAAAAAAAGAAATAAAGAAAVTAAAGHGPAGGSGAADDGGTGFAIPRIDDDRVAALVFTSGSTGRPTAHAKRWGSLVANVRAAAARLGLDGDACADRPGAAGSGRAAGRGRPTTVIGTVPAQHMYGFESTVLLALHNGLVLHAGSPFYPADIAAALAAAPGDRVLVTTPFHLRALLADGGPLPTVRLVLCATAPLSRELAGEVERRLGAPLVEIYGCTEAGQVATRRTRHGEVWQTLPGVRIEAAADAAGHPLWLASGGHVDAPTPLADVLLLDSPERFRLVGRDADLINIAGKRSSLAHLNQRLLDIDGIRDGAFFNPAGGGRDVVRLTAFYVSDTLTPADVLAALRARIDPVFLPRPLHRVAALPRAGTGKLPQAALAELAARLSGGRKRR